ncbi:MAG: glutathione-disulfide reductase [Janthinobacterium lividum]
MAYDYDLFVIGGGSGGVRCARIAAGHGARVAIAEERFWGGTCVNVGCVPKKLMVQASEYGALAEDSRGFGWDAHRAPFDWAALIAHKDHEIARLNAIYVTMLEKAGVAIHEHRATLTGPHTLDVGGRAVSAERIVVAVGGHPVFPHATPGCELGIVSDQAFELPEQPRRVVMVGGGYIGVEFAGIFAGLGSEVHLVYRQHLPLGGFDGEIREALAESLTAHGVALHPRATIERIEATGPTGSERRVTLADGTALDADLVFFAIGRVPNTKRLGLETAGVRLDDKGAVVVDAHSASSAPSVFAIGDVSNTMNLTPVAIAEGHVLADRLFGPGAPRRWSFDAIPTAVFSQPPIGTVGLSEEEAARRGPVDIYTTRFTPMRHTMSGRQGHRALMKLVVDQPSQRILGAHMIGDDAPEMMQGIGVAITAGATKAHFDQTIGIHPTGAEEWVTMRTRTREAGLREAAE